MNPFPLFFEKNALVNYAVQTLSYQNILPFLKVCLHEKKARSSHFLLEKGCVGRALDRWLGSTPGGHEDFPQFGVELKTLPLSAENTPTESTFLTSLSSVTKALIPWKQSRLYKKIQTILWIPFLQGKVHFADSFFLSPFLWAPSEEELKIFESDWRYFTYKLVSGELNSVSGWEGEYVQVRPKGANKAARQKGYDAWGEADQVSVRAFYLRNFAKKLLLSKPLSRLKVQEPRSCFTQPHVRCQNPSCLLI